MRRCLAVALVCGLVQVPLSAAVIDNLVAYWSLDEASGNAIDAATGNDLTETVGTIASTTGRVSTARDFEATETEYFAIADNADLSTGDIDFTIAAWVQLESKPATEMDIVSKFETSGNQREYRMRYFNTTDRLTWTVDSNGATPVTVSWGSAPSTATWYFVVAWHDSVNNVIGISVNDGTPVTSAHTVGVLNGTSPFHIGALGRAAATFYWDGLIDEVGLWKKVLTAAEITWLYNAGNGRSYAEIQAEAGGDTRRGRSLLMGVGR